jgi:protocatechuate 3,4-dioxygenase, beta subunit
MRILIAVLLFTSTLAAQGLHEAPPGAPAAGRLAPRAEPGQALHVAGTVVDASGKPIPGASLYVYQTDHEGYYGVKPASDSRHPRLNLFLRADAKGAWSFDTVTPGSYPGTRNPAHIHFEVTANGRTPRIFEIVFEGDPFITDRMRSDPSFSVRQIESGRVTERITLP